MIVQIMSDTFVKKNTRESKEVDSREYPKLSFLELYIKLMN